MPHGSLDKLLNRKSLSRDEARGLFDAIMDGQVESHLLAAILAALATKGETVAELVGAAEAMRARAACVRVPAGVSAIDTCSAGGDGKPTFNISTAVAIVAAAAGATVAKHGNRSNARPSGSAEGLAALGVRIDADIATLERCLEECRVAFLFAPQLHPAMSRAAPVRKALGVRTIFNLVGPLTNPAHVRRQLMGVSRPELVAPVAEALRELGAERAVVVHGRVGLCDLSLLGPSHVASWDGTRLTAAEVTADIVRLPSAPLEALFVANPQESAATIERILAGQPGPPRDVVLFNAAAALWAAGIAADWSEGAARAREALDSGAAARTLAKWRAVSHGRSRPGE
ncbi:MAG: anthranilate phosphoribosyltransferase [Phycisphaerae bacterium]